MESVHGIPDGYGEGEEDMGPLEAWMIFIITSSCILVLMATLGMFRCKSMLVYWGEEVFTIIREYLQKTAMFNLLLLAILYVLYKYVFGDVADDKDISQCIMLGEHKLVAFLVVLGAMVVGIIRYLAVGFAHSDTYSDVVGAKPERHSSSPGAPGDTQVYMKMICPYQKMCVVVLLLVITCLYAPVPDEYTAPVLEIEFCLSSWPLDETGYNLTRLLPVTVLILLPTVTALCIEHITHVMRNGYFTQTPGYVAILNAPFIMVTLTTTWSMWLILVILVWWTFGLGAGEYFSMLALFYTSWDSLLLLFVTIVVGRQRKTISRLQQRV